MNTVHVNASKSYDILIGKGILSKAAELISSACPDVATVAVITDDRVDALYGESIMSCLNSAGYNTVKFVFPNGEASKNTSTLVEILNFLGENALTRSDAVLALGGGVVGDIAGFAASIFLRGIKFIQIPTTLLAMVDSSVGGKTAVDLPSGKNLAGSFWQPDIVICDPDTLLTLDRSTFADGCAEVIKYGCICDKELFSLCQNDGIENNIEAIIKRCVEIKAEVVTQDERDTGLRQILNFGHTVGHAVEKCSNYAIPHGSAVAIGMMIVSKGAYSLNLCKNDITSELKAVLQKHNLPTECTYNADELYNVTLNDKKRAGDSITLVLVDEIGSCKLQKLPAAQILDIIKAGL